MRSAFQPLALDWGIPATPPGHPARGRRLLRVRPRLDARPRGHARERPRGPQAPFTYRKSATWFRLLREAGFEVRGYHEPAPVTLAHGTEDPTRHYSMQKARIVPVTMIWECKSVTMAK